MDDARFDRVARSLAGAASRRTTLAGLLGGLVFSLAPAANARGRKRRNRNAVAAEKN